MKKIWIIGSIFVCTFLDLWAEPFSFQKDFDVIEGKKVHLEFHENHLTVMLNKREVVSQKYDEEVKETLAFIDEELKAIELITVGDYNSDGYNDFALCVSVGYGGLNTYRDYYFYDPKKDTFHRVLKSVSNLEKKEGMLFTSEKSSQTWYVSSYKFKDYMPYRYTEEIQQMGFPKKVKEYNIQGKLLKTYWDPNIYKVIVPKLYLSKKVYIIEGDKVSIEDVDYENNKVKIAYVSKNKTYKAWVNFAKLMSEEEWMHVEMWSTKK
jgi:hypothetical protein